MLDTVVKTPTHDSKMSRKIRSSDLEGGGNCPSVAGGVCEDLASGHDAVFGEITEKGPNYRNVCVSRLFNISRRLTIRRSVGSELLLS